MCVYLLFHGQCAGGVLVTETTIKDERSPLGLRCIEKRQKSTVGTLLKARYKMSS